MDSRPSGRRIRYTLKRTDYTWPCTWFTPRCDGKEGAFKDAYSVMNNWGANHGAISYGHNRRRPDYHVLHAENSGLHAQRSGREDLPSGCMERIRNGQRGRRLPRMQELRTSLQIRKIRKPYTKELYTPGRLFGHCPESLFLLDLLLLDLLFAGSSFAGSSFCWIFFLWNLFCGFVFTGAFYFC